MLSTVLYISIDGMTDSLGQSQVLPYLTTLAQKGFDITIVSSEKKENFEKNEKIISEIVSKYKIKWKYCFYETKIPLLSQIKNFKRLQKLTEKELPQRNEYVLLHCRSYLAALIGLYLKKKYKVKFIFDMRGFWADERIDGKIWSLKNPLHKILYKYFKRREKEMLSKADYIVTLTQDAKNIITEWMSQKKLPIQVIPCCVDTNHFTLRNTEQKLNTKKTLNFPENSYIVGYLGSIGTWYMLDEMFDYFIELKKKKNNAILFFVTPDSESQIRTKAEAKGILSSDLIIQSAKRNEVPELISTFDVGLFFIRPSFSKRGSSPTKLAELLSCGIPLITNAGVGDCDTIITENDCGVLLKNFSTPEYQKSLERLDELTKKSPEYFRNVALANFSLEKGVGLYEKIYLSLT